MFGALVACAPLPRLTSHPAMMLFLIHVSSLALVMSNDTKSLGMLIQLPADVKG